MKQKMFGRKLVSSIVAAVMLFSSFGWSAPVKYLRAPGSQGAVFFGDSPVDTTSSKNVVEFKRWDINLLKENVLKVFKVDSGDYAGSSTIMTAVVTAIGLCGVAQYLKSSVKEEKERIKRIKNAADAQGKAIFQKIADQTNSILMVRVNEGFRDKLSLEEAFNTNDIILPNRLKGQENAVSVAIRQGLEEYTALDGTTYQIHDITADVIEGTNKYVINVDGKTVAELPWFEAGTTSIVGVGDVITAFGNSPDVYTNVFVANVPEDKKSEFVNKPINPEDHAKDPKTIERDLERLAKAKGLAMEEYMSKLDFVIMDRSREIAKFDFLIGLMRKYKGFQVIVIADGTVAPSIAAMLGQKEGREVIVDTVGGAPEGFFVAAVAAITSNAIASFNVCSKKINDARSDLNTIDMDRLDEMKERVLTGIEEFNIPGCDEIKAAKPGVNAFNMDRRYDFTNKSTVKISSLNKSVIDAFPKVSLVEGNKIIFADGTLIFEGIMTEDEKNSLLKLSSFNAYIKAINSLFDASNKTETAEITNARTQYGDVDKILHEGKLFTQEVGAGKHGKFSIACITNNGVFEEEGVKRLDDGNYQVAVLRLEDGKSALIEHVIVPREEISSFLRSLKGKSETNWVDVLIKELDLNQNVKINGQILDKLRETLRLINGNNADLINQEYEIGKIICDKFNITKISQLDVLSNKPKLNFTDVTSVNKALEGIVEISDSGVKVLKLEALRDGLIDKLAYDATFNSNKDVVALCRKLIWNIAPAVGAEIKSSYDEMKKKGTDKRKYSWPAINVRGMAFNTARAVFSSMVKNKVTHCKLEIAKSEIKYSDQKPIEYTTTILAAAIKEGYEGPLYLQGDHFQVALKDYTDNPRKAVDAAKELIRSAVKFGEFLKKEYGVVGFRDIDLDCSPLVDWTKEDFIRSLEKLRLVLEPLSDKKLVEMAFEANLMRYANTVDDAHAALKNGLVTRVSLKNDLLTHWEEIVVKELVKIKQDKANTLDMSPIAGWLGTIRNSYVDVSPLEAWLKKAREEQQHHNAIVSAELTAYARMLEKQFALKEHLDLGVEVGEIGKGLEKGKERNSIPEDIYSFDDIYKRELNRLSDEAGYEIVPAGRIAVMTGTQHGGTRGKDGKIVKAKVSFNALNATAKAALERGYAGVNQHGASTLDPIFYVIFAGNRVPEGYDVDPELLSVENKNGIIPVAEVHLATAYQDTIYDHKNLPAALAALVRLNTQERFAPKDEKELIENRKNAWGPLKVQFWNLPATVQTQIRGSLELQFDTVFKNLGVAGLEAEPAEPVVVAAKEVVVKPSEGKRGDAVAPAGLDAAKSSAGKKPHRDLMKILIVVAEHIKSNHMSPSLNDLIKKGFTEPNLDLLVEGGYLRKVQSDSESGVKYENLVGYHLTETGRAALDATATEDVSGIEDEFKLAKQALLNASNPTKELVDNLMRSAIRDTGKFLAQRKIISNAVVAKFPNYVDEISKDILTLGAINLISRNEAVGLLFKLAKGDADSIKTDVDHILSGSMGGVSNSEGVNNERDAKKRKQFDVSKSLKEKIAKFYGPIVAKITGDRVLNNGVAEMDQPSKTPRIMFITEKSIADEKISVGVINAFADGIEKRKLGEVQIVVVGDASAANLQGLSSKVSVVSAITAEKIKECGEDNYRVIAADGEVLSVIQDSKKITRLPAVSGNKVVFGAAVLLGDADKLIVSETERAERNIQLEAIATDMLKILQLGGALVADYSDDELAALAKSIVKSIVEADSVIATIDVKLEEYKRALELIVEV